MQIVILDLWVGGVKFKLDHPITLNLDDRLDAKLRMFIMEHHSSVESEITITPEAILEQIKEKKERLAREGRPWPL